MKKIYILICFIVVINITTKAQYVTIPDANFAAWLNANIPSAMTNGNQMDTTSTAVTSLISMDISNLGITNLDGIQYFDSLQDLDCGDITFPGNQNTIASILSLPHSLINFNCDGNQLTNLPILPSSLLTLSCRYNQLISLPTLPNLLQTIDCGNNQIDSLPTLPNDLKKLICHHNNLNFLPMLPDSLKELNFSTNNISIFPSMLAPAHAPPFRCVCANSRPRPLPSPIR